MSKAAILLLFFLKIFSVCGQSNENIELIGFSASQCDNNYPYERLVRTRIVSKNYLNGIYSVEIGIFENCSGVNTPNINFSNDTLQLFYEIGELGKIDTISIDSNESGKITFTTIQSYNIAECNCCFHFIYSIKGLENKNYIISLNNIVIEYSPDKFLLFPIKFELYDNATINYIDEFGLKQGLWLKEKSVVETWFNYKDNIRMQLIQKKYYPNRKLKEEKVFVHMELFERKEYFKNGKLKCECVNDDKNKQLLNCIRWNKKGKLIKENNRTRP